MKFMLILSGLMLLWSKLNCHLKKNLFKIKNCRTTCCLDGVGGKTTNTKCFCYIHKNQQPPAGAHEEDPNEDYAGIIFRCSKQIPNSEDYITYVISLNK
jgi:hypothetical protein